MFSDFLSRLLAKWLCAIKRPPDVSMGGEEDPYLVRWWLIPENRFFNVYLHRFLRDDDDRVLHDHPWHSVSLLLKGQVLEVYRMNDCNLDQTRVLYRGQLIYRKASFAHRLFLPQSQFGGCPDAWVLFVTGPVIGRWWSLRPKKGEPKGKGFWGNLRNRPR